MKIRPIPSSTCTWPRGVKVTLRASSSPDATMDTSTNQRGQEPHAHIREGGQGGPQDPEGDLLSGAPSVSEPMGAR